MCSSIHPARQGLYFAPAVAIQRQKTSLTLFIAPSVVILSACPTSGKQLHPMRLTRCVITRATPNIGYAFVEG